MIRQRIQLSAGISLLLLLLLLATDVAAAQSTIEKAQGIPVNDPLIISKCAYRIADFNGDGLDDIADWCRISYKRMDPPQEEISMEDRLILFTRKGGSLGLKEVAEKEESLRIRKAICTVQPKKAPCSSLPH